MQPARLLKTLEGRRVSDVHCYCCGGQTAVLRQRWCKDELELFCDRCETWSGRRVTVADVEVWMRRRQYKFPFCDFDEARAASR
jgi:hypothetical protein